MGSIVIELTNRCNLNCRHCYNERHSADGYLKVDIIEKILGSAGTHGFDHLSFTGGEPTLHPDFARICHMASHAAYKFGFVTNGWNFSDIYDQLLSCRELLTGITFSLDGSTDKTHDIMRGDGSFRRLMSAVSICMIKGIPFTFNTLITTNNHDELRDITELAAKLGSRGHRFGHLIPTPNTGREKLILSPEQQKKISGIVLEIDKTSDIPVLLAPGYYTTDLFPCAPLQKEEINIDWRGNVTMCCHLSGYCDGAERVDVTANLEHISFSEAHERVIESIRRLHYDKLRHCKRGNWTDSDYFPCWYCLNYYSKVDWINGLPENPWSQKVWTDNIERMETANDRVK